MNTQKLSLMMDMLNELVAGRWQPTRAGFVSCTHRQPTFFPDVWVMDLDHPMGASGCAIGFACLDARFPGLDYVNLEPSARVTTRADAARTVTGWAAVCEYFGMEEGMARWLFGAEGNASSWGQVRDWLGMVLENAERDCAQAVTLPEPQMRVAG